MQKHLAPPYTALSFRYGQRHEVELVCAAEVAEALGIPHEVLDIGDLWTRLAVASALTQDLPITEGPHGLPTTFVPGRNLIFLTLAAIWGYSREFHDIVIGVSQVDYSGYPDCRGGFIAVAQEAISRAFDKAVRIHAPFLEWDKARLWRYAADVGILPLIVQHTHTCYRGVRDVMYAWGYGCGACPACRLRQEGYQRAFSTKMGTDS